MATILFVVQPHRTGAAHRFPVIHGAIQAGHQVEVATAKGSDAWDFFVEKGLSPHHVPLTRAGFNPLREFRVVLALLRLYRNLDPSILHHASIKPVIFGGIAARIFGKAAVISTIPGLGHVFIDTGRKAAIRRRIVCFLYSIAFRNRRQKVCFQNNDDLQTLAEDAKIPHRDIVLIPGSGVEMEKFHPSLVRTADKIYVSLVGRMLESKGVNEFVEAARLLKERHDIVFRLVGGVDQESPSAISYDVITQWVSEGVVEWLGEVEDVRTVYSDSSIVCLPSYGEGLPKTLLEAASCGLPIVTTDVAGCRDIVIDGETGYIVPVRDHVLLAERILELADSPRLRQEFGASGRQLVARKFSTDKIVGATLVLYGSFEK